MKNESPLIFVTNDDGVYASGIEALILALAPLGRVVVLAPDSQRSAASHSITLHRPLRLNEVSADRYSTDGTPADCVIIGLRWLLKEKPALVVSGINDGPNLADDVHYSGTVAAAMEAAVVGVPAIAVSLNSGCDRHFKTAAHAAYLVAKDVLRNGMAAGTMLNVNAPNIPQSEVRGFANTFLGKGWFGSGIEERVDPRNGKYYWIGGKRETFDGAAGSDIKAIVDGFISVTPLNSNLTDRAALDALRASQIDWAT